MFPHHIPCDTSYFPINEYFISADNKWQDELKRNGMVLNALNTNDCQIIFNNEQNSVHLITYLKFKNSIDN